MCSIVLLGCATAYLIIPTYDMGPLDGRPRKWRKKPFWTFRTCGAPRRTPGTRCWKVFWAPDLITVRGAVGSIVTRSSGVTFGRRSEWLYYEWWMKRRQKARIYATGNSARDFAAPRSSVNDVVADYGDVVASSPATDPRCGDDNDQSSGSLQSPDQNNSNSNVKRKQRRYR